MNTQAEDTIKVLIVEDMPAAAERLQLALEDVLQVDVTLETDFDEALRILQPPRGYEAIILDLYLGDPFEAANREGEKVWERIWNTRLMPIIIHTANPSELEPEPPPDNPFIRVFTKSEDSGEAVAEYLRSIQPYLLTLREVEQEFNHSIHQVLKQTSPALWAASLDNQELRATLLLRNARRRLAAMMDFNTTITDEKLQSWEQYIYPPLGDSLLMGDLLRIQNGAVEDPNSYYLVLTPSCDLQMRNGRCKVSSVLVAKCTRIEAYVQAFQNQISVKKKAIAERLPSFLTEPHFGGYIPLPEYKSILPQMAANLRDLELIRVSDIGGVNEDAKPFIRIASVDSPFREHIAWAYLQIAGRPGVPDRDLASWTQIILDEVLPEEQR